MRHPATPRLAVLLLPAVALLALASCGDERLDPYNAASCERLLDDAANVDVYDWLKAPAPVPRRPGKMAVDDALALAHQFEARGAERMLAVGSREVLEPGSKSPYFYSTGFVLRLPDDPVKRLQIFRLYAEQVRTNGFNPRADTGQKALLIPWTQDELIADD
ncbi:MAG TPA: hypothetical protein VG406_22375 [Isosphaeraceae bacterium]|nr:hypothetical protein [Isosphaeraceae bacterium]